MFSFLSHISLEDGMIWFKHFTDWYRDPDICDAYQYFSHLAYVFFQCLKEAYAEYHDLRDEYGFVRLSQVNLALRCHSKPRKILQLFSFFQKRNRLSYRVEDEFVFFQVFEFEKLIGHWRNRRNYAAGAPSVFGCGYEDKKKRRKEE